MPAVLIRVENHADKAAPTVPAGKLVVSRIGHGESPIRCDVTSIKLMLEGEEIHEVDGRPYVVRPGQMLLVDRGADYRVVLRRNQATRGLCVYLPGPVLGPCASQETAMLGRALILATEASPLGLLLQQRAAELHQGTALSDAASDAMMDEIRASLAASLVTTAAQMARIDVRKASTRNEVMNRLEIARAHLHAHPDRAVALSELAHEAGLSSFHLVRYFSAAYGLPPGRYHRKLRLDRAAEALRRNEGPVTGIAERAGYAELSAFTHAFVRQFGVPPTAWGRRAG